MSTVVYPKQPFDAYFHTDCGWGEGATRIDKLSLCNAKKKEKKKVETRVAAMGYSLGREEECAEKRGKGGARVT